MKIAVVGATGMVGQVMLKVLEERNLPITELIPVASEKSVGKKITFKSKQYDIVSMETAISMKPEIAIFSAGGSTSLEYAPKFAEVGCTVIDNSSAWRMDPTKKLVVPEINAHVLTKEDKIIANPNCSTIQMVMVLNPLHLKYKVKRVIVSTYQSVSGTGKAKRKTLLGSAGLALGLGPGLACALGANIKLAASSMTPMPCKMLFRQRWGILTVTQSTKFTAVLCRQKTPEQVTKSFRLEE